jgi:hypothetical protein
LQYYTCESVKTRKYNLIYITALKLHFLSLIHNVGQLT